MIETNRQIDLLLPSTNPLYVLVRQSTMTDRYPARYP